MDSSTDSASVAVAGQRLPRSENSTANAACSAAPSPDESNRRGIEPQTGANGSASRAARALRNRTRSPAERGGTPRRRGKVSARHARQLHSRPAAGRLPTAGQQNPGKTPELALVLTAIVKFPCRRRPNRRSYVEQALKTLTIPASSVPRRGRRSSRFSLSSANSSSLEPHTPQP